VSAFAGVDTTRVLLAGMKTAEMNHRYLANNIANVDTPDYNPVNLDFQRTLRAAIDGRESVSLRKDHPRHIEVRRNIAKFEGLASLSKNDYNKVDLDDQMARLSENTGQYTTYASLVSKRFQMVRNMLNGLSR